MFCGELNSPMDRHAELTMVLTLTFQLNIEPSQPRFPSSRYGSNILELGNCLYVVQGTGVFY